MNIELPKFDLKVNMFFHSIPLPTNNIGNTLTRTRNPIQYLAKNLHTLDFPSKVFEIKNPRGRALRPHRATGIPIGSFYRTENFLFKKKPFQFK